MRNKIEEILNGILLDSDESNLDVNLIYSRLEEIKKLPKLDPNEVVMGDPTLTELIIGYTNGDNTAKLKLADYVISNIKAQEKGMYSEIPASDYKIEAQELGRSLANDELISKFRLSFDDQTWNRVASFSDYEVRYILGYLNNVQIPYNAIWLFSNQNKDIWVFARLGGAAILTLNVKNQIINVSSLWKVLTEMMMSRGTDVDIRDLELILQKYGMTYNVESKCEDLLPPPKFVKSVNDIVKDQFNVELRHPIVFALAPEVIAVEDHEFGSDVGKLIFFGSKHCLLVDIFRNYDSNRDALVEEFSQSNEGNFPDERSSEDYKMVAGNYEVPPFELSSYSVEKSNFCKKLSYESEGGIKVTVELRGEYITPIRFEDLNTNRTVDLKYSSELLSDEDIYNVCKLLVGVSKPSDDLDTVVMDCMGELSKQGSFN